MSLMLRCASTSPKQAKALAAELAIGATLYFVQAQHHFVPGNPMSLHATSKGANEEAAKLVNIIRKDLELSADATMTTWPSKLNAARKKHARDLGCKQAELGDDDCDVWITPMEIKA